MDANNEDPTKNDTTAHPTDGQTQPAPETSDAHTLQKITHTETPNDSAASEASTIPATPEAAAAPSTAAAAPTVLPRTSLFRRHGVGMAIGGAAVLAIGLLGGGGFALGAAYASSEANTSSTVIQLPNTTQNGNSGSSTRPDTFTVPDTQTQPGTDPRTTLPFGGSAGNSADTSTDATAATDDQQLGVVTIVSTLYYDESTRAAGTGMVLTSSGQILTNNHVIDGATSIEVTVESTGETYSATVVGTDATADIALLQLDDASGLDVVTTDDSALAVGDTATSVGNAEGTGDLVAATGTITALDEDITVGNEYTGSSESLTGLIEMDADVVSGDSGGPLVDADGEVIGVVTAASSGAANITGFAVPIATALDVVDQIESGVETDTVQIGGTAFLGVQLATTQQSDGVLLGGVIDNTPAATSGLTAGDIITAVDGQAVTTADELSSLIEGYEAGDSVTVSYTTADGAAQELTVTLMDGPA